MQPNLDYDSDPYWERTGTVDPDYPAWMLDCACKNCTEDSHCKGCMDCEYDFLDPETGDAFRIISRG